MPQTFKPKPCVECLETYTPTGACQKRCPKCMAKGPASRPSRAAKVTTPHPFGKDVPAGPAVKKVNGTRQALTPSMTINCTMLDAVAIFHALAEAGCTCLVFGNTKLTIEAV